MRIKTDITKEKKSGCGTKCCDENLYIKDVSFIQKGKRPEVWGTVWLCIKCQGFIGHDVLDTRLDYDTLIVAARHGGQVIEGKDGKIESVFKCAGCGWCAPKKKDR